MIFANLSNDDQNNKTRKNIYFRNSNDVSNDNADTCEKNESECHTREKYIDSLVVNSTT